MEALAWGWDSAATIGLFLAGAAVLGGFVRLELRAAHPLLDVSLLRRRVLDGIVVAMFCAQFVLNGFVIYIATYFQHVLGYGALLASVAMVPSMLLGPYFNMLVGRLTDRIGARTPAILGYSLAALAFALDRDLRRRGQLLAAAARPARAQHRDRADVHLAPHRALERGRRRGARRRQRPRPHDALDRRRDGDDGARGDHPLRRQRGRRAPRATRPPSGPRRRRGGRRARLRPAAARPAARGAAEAPPLPAALLTAQALLFYTRGQQ